MYDVCIMPATDSIILPAVIAYRNFDLFYRAVQPACNEAVHIRQRLSARSRRREDR